MARLVRHEFMGSRLLLFLYFLVPFLLPLGIVYLLEATVTVNHEMEDPEAFLVQYRAKKG